MNKEYKLFEKRFHALRLLGYDEAMKETKKFLSEAIKNKNKSDEAIVYYLIGIISRYKDKYKTALRYYFKAEKILNALNSLWWVASVNHAIGHCYFFKGQNAESLPYLEKSYNYYCGTNDKYKQAMLLINIGLAYGALGEYDKRLDSYKKASGIFYKLKLDHDYSISLNNISIAYKDAGDLPNALKYLKESTGIFIKIGDKEKICGNYSNMGEIYMMMNNRKAALKYFRLAYKFLSENISVEISVPVILNLGRCFLNSKNYIQAEKYLTEGLEKSRLTGQKFREMQAYKYLAIIYYYLKMFERSFEYMNNALNLSVKLKSRTETYDIYRYLSVIYSGISDYKSALKYYTRYHKIYTGVFNGESDRRVKELKVTFEKEKAEKDAEIIRLQNRELKREIDSKTKELTAAANFIVQKNDLLSSAFGELKNFITSGTHDLTDKSRLIKEIELIERKKQLSGELVRFEQNLNRINISFIDKLSKKYQLLTRIELKICSMLKINLGTKEIAKMLSLSPRTVESHRYHILHKLKLAKGKSLTQFIHTI